MIVIIYNNFYSVVEIPAIKNGKIGIFFVEDLHKCYELVTFAK